PYSLGEITPIRHKRDRPRPPAAGSSPAPWSPPGAGRADPEREVRGTTDAGLRQGQCGLHELPDRATGRLLGLA
ncbi:MAG TPA: hypothetical protein VIH85_10695, partial [Solirubrobacteraceae bacterium]